MGAAEGVGVLSAFRRRRRPPLAPLRSVDEAEVAVGSLSGVAPSDIRLHVLVVLDKTGRVSVTSAGCPETTVLLLAEVLASLARQAAAGHACGSGT